MAPESSPGRKPGVKVPNIFLEPSQRATESAKLDRIYRRSFAPNGALFGSRGSHPGLTPGATLCRPLNADSLSAAFRICLFPKFILVRNHRVLLLPCFISPLLHDLRAVSSFPRRAYGNTDTRRFS